MTIIKRNGNIVDFDRDKIVKAINKAFIEVDGKLYETDTANSIADEIALLNKEKLLGVEEIQDLVEDYLMRSERRDVARAYIRFRYRKEMSRKAKKDWYASISNKLMAKDVKNQNANVDEHSFGGRVGEASDLVMRQFALDNCISKMARENHLNNQIYIHDLSAYAVGNHNCLSIPFDKLLAEGFNTRQTDVRPAGSVNTAFQLVAVIFQLQSLQQFGGVSATHLDWTMVPYVRKSFRKHWNDGLKYMAFWEVLEEDYVKEDKPIDEYCKDDDYKRIYEYALDQTIKETRQAAEGLYHNLNTLQSRSGNQLPFTSINYGTCTLPEGRMVIDALLDVSIEGLGRLRKTSVFPCGIFQSMRGVNQRPGDPNYDLFKKALRSTAQRLYPNYANVDWSGNAGYDINRPETYFSTMGCRTANGWDINGLGQQKDGRGNICPVTIILPTIAMEAKEMWCEDVANEETLIETFMNYLDIKIHEAKDMLLERFKYICSQDPASARFMYENGLMAGYKPEEGIHSALRHGTLALGQLGLAETLQILVGCDHTEPTGMELAKRIEQLFKDRCAEFKNEYSLNFGVYYSPAENLCFTAMKKFKEKYGEIPKVSDREYFTNSMHVPVWHKMSVFEKIDIESKLTGYSSAGCITYVELDSGIKNNLDALETLVIYAMEKDIPYFAVNVPNDTCLECGYCDEFNDHCPVCGSGEIQQLRRVTGYLTGNYKTAFNAGKQAEVEDRVKHSAGREL